MEINTVIKLFQFSNRSGTAASVCKMSGWSENPRQEERLACLDPHDCTLCFIMQAENLEHNPVQKWI